MKINRVRQELILIEEPSEKLLDLVQRMREHKKERREKMRNVPPMFTLHA